MSKGFDTPSDGGQVAHLAAAAGYGFIAMYYFAQSAYKTILNKPRALAISAAGLHVVSVFENGYPTGSGYFTPARAITDAQIAVQRATDATQPKGTPIYFAVDCDLAPAKATAYFEQIHKYLTAHGYKVGVYGSGAVCKALHDAGLVEYTWLSQSHAWGGYEEWLPHANLLQAATGTFHGLDVDWDTSPAGNGGGWQIS